MKMYRPYPDQDDTNKLGESTLFSIDLFRAKSSVNPKKMTEYLLKKELDENRYTQDINDISFQDLKLPINNPDSKLLSTLMVDVINKVTKKMDLGVRIMGGWTIINHHHYQTFPHDHVDEKGSNDMACVYWAQVPENSGSLSFWPLGMPGPARLVEPKEGEFLVFPADLLHGVRQNTASEPRVSVSFNLHLTSRQ